MNLSVNVDGNQIRKLDVDSRGRVTLGADYTNEHVSVGIVDGEKPDQSDGSVEVLVDLESIVTRTVGAGGRVSVGSEHAGEIVTVAVLSRDDE